MSLSQRLKQMQQVDNSELSDLSHLPLADLHQEKVNFGQKYPGVTFQEAWKDQEWIQFVASRFSTSTKLAHRMLIRYIELQVDWHEVNNAAIPRVPPVESRTSTTGLSRQMPVFPRLQAKSKAAPKAAAAHNIGGMVETHEDPDDWELDSVMFQNGYTDPTMTNPPGLNMAEMQDRLLNMENVMNRMITHLEQQANTAARATEPDVP